MSVDKQGDLRIDSWLIKIFLTNGEEKTIVDVTRRDKSIE